MLHTFEDDPTNLIGRLNVEALENREYWTILTHSYNMCPHCNLVCEIQANYYGRYCEGPGYITFKDEKLRCPSCLEVLGELPVEVQERVARWQMQGGEIIYAD